VDIYAKLGVRTFINARGPLTRMGGAIMPPEVIDAMVTASKSSVYLAELQDAIGARIAAMTGNEAAMVTNGAAAGIVLAIAACMTGDDRKKMASLPDTNSCKNEVIVQHHMRFSEDCALRNTGARLVEIDGAGAHGIAALKAAIGPKTAALFTTDWTGSRTISIHDLVPIAREHNLPVVVDAAAGLPPAKNLWKFTREMGADLAIFSGGKGLRGPQSSGLVVGTKQLIDAMKMQSVPHCYIGRPMKVGKEEMVGLYAALECLLATPDEERNEQLEKLRRQIESRLRHFAFLKFENDGDRLTIKWNESARAMTAEDVAARMRSGTPAIECSCTEGLHLHVSMLRDGEAEIVAARLAKIFGD